jgi:hypothetical protein
MIDFSSIEMCCVGLVIFFGVAYDSLYLNIGQGELIIGLLVLGICVLKGFGQGYSWGIIFG